MNDKYQTTYESLKKQLLNSRNEKGFWTGKLSSSALGTAVAITAFKMADEEKYSERIQKGLQWLKETINEDGGFGDSPESISNVSTSMLSYAAIKYCGNGSEMAEELSGKIKSYSENQNIGFDSENLAKSILDFYGKDLTFSVPILSMLALCKVSDEDAFEYIPALPFEFSLLPTSLYRFFNLQVVSYALPALIAMGIANLKMRKRTPAILKWVRRKCVKASLRKLENMMPESGGFLEAIPLTAFVNLCLVASGFADEKVVKQGLVFLENKQRKDGSWPIDTDLSSWVSSLSIKALGSDLPTALPNEDQNILRNHFLNLQYTEKHAFNQAEPGGFGWTDYSGSVPDADDTPGALLALMELFQDSEKEINAIRNGIFWLVNLQNRDGGIPTFCKGWGRLPFDASCTDLTGHALYAFIRAKKLLTNELSDSDKRYLEKAIRKAIHYLKKEQYEEGFLLPLWFGNQNAIEMKNPVYGTAKVCIYLRDAMSFSEDENIQRELNRIIEKGERYLLNQQNEDGSWGAHRGVQGSIEETALAVSACLKANKEAAEKGLDYLQNRIEKEGIKSSPIGLYFAALWYDEELYPLIYAVEAFCKWNQL